MKSHTGKSSHSHGFAGIVVIIIIFVLAIIGIIGYQIIHFVNNQTPSGYIKCNGLEKLAQEHIGGLATSHTLLEKEYTCRGIGGNTPQRNTSITFTYGSTTPSNQSEDELRASINTELEANGWIKPGISSSNARPTDYRLKDHEEIGIRVDIESPARSIFSLYLYAKDTWQSPVDDTRKPQYFALKKSDLIPFKDHEVYAPTFIPAGYTNWTQKPLPNAENLGDQNVIDFLTSTSFTLKGGKTDIGPSIWQTAYPGDSELERFCQNACIVIGTNQENYPIYHKQGDVIYSRLGNTLTTIDGLTNRNSSPVVGVDAATPIIKSMHKQ